MNDSPYSGINTRRNVKAFLIGKVPTALLTMTALWLASHYLTPIQFGLYVTVMATLEVSLGFSSFGLDWILLRYIPSYRVAKSRFGLIRLIKIVSLIRFSILLLFTICVLILKNFGVYNNLFITEGITELLCLLVIIEGMMRVFRDNIIESLALQRYLQIVLIIKGLCIVSGLILLNFFVNLNAIDFLFVELCASCVSLIISFLIVTKEIKKIVGLETYFQIPTWKQMRNTALSNYASGFIQYFYSTSFLLLILALFQPVEVIAGVGFVVRLTEIIRNYLPSMLLFSVVRSRMIGVYAQTNSYLELRNWAIFLFKFSIITLLPVCAAVGIHGDLLLNITSSNNYSNFASLFFVLCVWLGLNIHNNIISIVFNATHLMPYWVTSFIMSGLLFPFIVWFGGNNLGIWLIPACLFINEIFLSLGALRVLNHRGLLWSSCGVWLVKALVAVFLATIASLAATFFVAENIFFGVYVLFIAYGIICFLIGVLANEDALLLNRIAGKKLFKSADDAICK
jgi:hypothetical protein